MSWGEGFALLAYFYGFSPSDIASFTLFQYRKYITEIPKVHRIFNPPADMPKGSVSPHKNVRPYNSKSEEIKATVGGMSIERVREMLARGETPPANIAP